MHLHTPLILIAHKKSKQQTTKYYLQTKTKLLLLFNRLNKPLKHIITSLFRPLQQRQHKMNLVKSTSLFLATIPVANAHEGGKLRGVTAVSYHTILYINLCLIHIICSHIICPLSTSMMSMYYVFPTISLYSSHLSSM